MLLTLSLVFYAVLGGATFARLMQFFDIIERPEARVRWLLVSVVAAILWPLTWAMFAVLAWLAKREGRENG